MKQPKRPEWWTELVPERDIDKPVSAREIIGDNIIAISACLPFYREDARMTILLERDLNKWQGYEKQLNGN